MRSLSLNGTRTRSTDVCRTWKCKGTSCGEKPTASRRRRIRRPGGSFIYTRLSCTGMALMKPKAAGLLRLQIGNSSFTHTSTCTPNAVPDAHKRLSLVAEQRLLYYQRAARNVAGMQLRFFRKGQVPHSSEKLRSAA